LDLERRRGVEELIKLNTSAPRSQYLHRRLPEMANKQGFAGLALLWCVRVEARGAMFSCLSWARLVVGDCWRLAKKFISRSGAVPSELIGGPSRLGGRGSQKAPSPKHWFMITLLTPLLYSKLFFVSLI
jgi:hypothetical protein